MKSAYEIAMEKLEKESGPTRKLTDEQRARIAEIEKRFEAQAAEQRLAYQGKMGTATSYEELEQLKKELAESIAALEAKRDREKDEVWESE
jgi:hypothetical protein